MNNEPITSGETVAAPAPEAKPAPPGGKLPPYLRFKRWYLEHKKWAIPASVLLLILFIFLLPVTRYKVASLAVKKNYNLQVSDATANIPVSGATVTVNGIKTTTDAKGHAYLPRLSAGHHKVTITKSYYKDRSIDILVPILAQKQVPNILFTATGRQVKISVVNLINGKSVSGAEINIDGTKSLTDDKGNALAVLPAGTVSKQVDVSAKGYNDGKAAIEVANDQIKQNTIKLTPAGQIYFLSKLSGKIDLVKANLDGSSRQTVLAGTGREDDRATVLLASRDWQYLALLANRDGAPKIYIINTQDDSLVTADQSAADFTAVGWHDHYFVYTVSKHNYNAWQPNAFSIKSYNADGGKILTLTNSNATGSSLDDAEYENIWAVQLIGNDVVYSRTWYKYPGYLTADGKQNKLDAIHVDGTSSRTLKSVDASNSYISSLKLSKPYLLEFAIYNTTTSDINYFTFDKTGTVNQVSEIKDLNDDPITYLQSPSGNQTFWQEPRDGKNSLFIGDEDAASPQQVANLSDYSTYGWYSDQYLLVSKNSSELYVIPVSGLKADSAAIKITDYHKPAGTFYGYGGGYGGF
jgi:hypothetical protein